MMGSAVTFDLPLPRAYICGRCMVAVFYGMCFGCFSGSTGEQLRPCGVLHVAHAIISRTGLTRESYSNAKENRHI